MKLETSARGTIPNAWESEEATQAVLARSSLVGVGRAPTPSLTERTQQRQLPVAADTRHFICADRLHIAAVQCAFHSVLEHKYSNDSHFIHFKPQCYEKLTVYGKSEMKSACLSEP
jgi:hypothetical protein